MFDLDNWREVFATLRANRLRTFLTGLGVFLGIVILMLMVGFGRSLQAGVKKQMGGFAANAVFLGGGRTSQAHAGLPPNRRIEFTNADIEALRKVDGIADLAPRIQLGGFGRGFNVRYKGKTANGQILGDYPAFQNIGLPVMLAGRFIDEIDLTERRKICVIGTGVIEQLYPPGVDPLGTYVELSGVYYQVVGVVGTRQKGMMGDRALNTIHVPLTTFQQAFNMGDKIGIFAINGRPDVDASDLETRIRALLSERHKVAPGDDMAIWAWNTGKEFQKQADMFLVIELVLGIAGIMTLAAGVIGVTNIMLISVRERTKELGVRKALGARPSTIVRMVVTESTTLTIIAGYLGIVAGVATIELWNQVILPTMGDDVPFGPAEVGVGFAFFAATVLAVFGAIAGVIPAYHAAKIQPVEALRSE